jgi:hypothetical protein
MISATPGLRRFFLASVSAASLAGAVAFPAVAGAAPNCGHSAAGNPNQCCVKVGDAPGPGPDCVGNDNNMNDGLLGDLPVVGNLPGLGGVL